ncbi:hypothetical protein SAMN05660964_02796 [Thiothrix caldifontis]|uniref:Trypsin-like peptidase domain-containing protein n=1 Tax=Thiothrix caldifontis TaxID=525918 RepID=A0A1H4F3X6_9GAMM|nr:hypothetical protein [Thiothrix caldifontis]SEA91182.1 hypothetical protein SAMN05660964_02796 [Thiothrix caldifontis]
MKIITLAGLLLLLMNNVQANGQQQAVNTLRAAPEVFQGGAHDPAMAALRLPMHRTVAARSATTQAANVLTAVTLPALDDADIQLLQNKPGMKAYRVGVGRDLPTSISQPIALDTWQWTGVGAGKVAHFHLTSSGALRVRAQLQRGKIPEGVELRFFSPTHPDKVFESKAEANSLTWSPTVAGDTLGLELFLPNGVEPQQVELAIPQLSHLVVDPASSQLKSSLFKADYTSCQQDIACASPAWQETGKAVARYVFTDTDGLSYLCSGTVLTDNDVYTQIPYFFTAAHCIDNQQAASSMDMFWLYANATCGGNDSSVTQTSGGAQLLVSKTTLDTSFLHLNNNPPSGVLMSGWTTESLTSNQAVTGIHHALGSPKKYAMGNFQGHARIETGSGGYSVTPDANGDFSNIVWHTGITAPGSSGSGVWVEADGVHYLNGSLLGGSSDCATPDAPDEYSRFERTWPFISAWLGAEGVPPSLRLRHANTPPTGLVEGVIVARYLQGLRGTALVTGVTRHAFDLATLETALASVQQVMDIDNDGSKQADKDAVLLVRYLMGLRNAALIQGVDLSVSGRKTASSIETYLDFILNPVD